MLLHGLIYSYVSESISSIMFDISGKYFVSIGDKHAQVFHNITGYRAIITDLEEKERRSQGGAMKERLRVQIQEARYFIHHNV